MSERLSRLRARRFDIELDDELNNLVENPVEHKPVSKKVLDLRSHTTGIVGAVTEKVSNDPVIAPSFPNASAPIDGFPQPVHRNNQSIFRQKKRQARIETLNENVKAKSEEPKPNINPEIPESDYMEIDQETTQYIENMTDAEITEAREMLLKSLKPGFTEKLMKGKTLAQRLNETSSYQPLNRQDQSPKTLENEES
ncbi:8917_t:CDS:1, partial [Racocetra persica]